jgi:hypothetical protein
MKKKEVVETSSPSINGKPERTDRSKFTSDRELHVHFDREGSDVRAHI